MSDNIKDGGPAFPNPGHDNGPGNFRGRPTDGMTLRDYFAAKAMGPCLVEFWRGVAALEYGVPEDWRMGIAIDAYAMADAMLAAREQS
jgi:hypothetical protein